MNIEVKQHINRHLGHNIRHIILTLNYTLE